MESNSQPVYFADIFSELEWREFGKEYAVYQLIARNGRILYVGMTGAIQTRLRSHRNQKRIPFFKARYVLCKDKFNAQQLEREMVEALAPPYNNHFCTTWCKGTDGRKWVIPLKPRAEFRLRMEEAN
jgi:predicted GIY-YIG superfamily endonuclease